MKKVLFLSVVAVALFSTSCKKNYVCECTILGDTSKSEAFKDTKKNAEDKCKADETDAKTVDPNATCTAVKQ